MVAYSFKREFIQPIQDRVKPHTLRGLRRRHARPGEQMQLFYAMRTKACRRIGVATCDRFQWVHLNFRSVMPIYIGDCLQVDGRIERIAELRPIEAVDAFAISDGFDNIESMARFWRDQHDVTEWQGFLIGWDVTTLVLGDAAAVAA